MTVHVAKGLEFKNVFRVGLEEGIFPHFRLARGSRGDRRGAPPLLRGDDPRMERLTLLQRHAPAHARADPLQRAERFLAEIPDELITGRRKRFGFDRESGAAESPRASAPARMPAPAPRESGRRSDYSEAQWSPDDAPYRSTSGWSTRSSARDAIMEVVGAGPPRRPPSDSSARREVIKMKYAQLRLVG